MRTPYYEQTSQHRRDANEADRVFTEELRDQGQKVIDSAATIGTPAAMDMASAAGNTFYLSIMIDELRAIRNELADIREALAR